MEIFLIFAWAEFIFLSFHLSSHGKNLFICHWFSICWDFYLIYLSAVCVMPFCCCWHLLTFCEGPFHVINHSRWLELNLSILLFCKMQEKVMMPYSWCISNLRWKGLPTLHLLVFSGDRPMNVLCNQKFLLFSPLLSQTFNGEAVLHNRNH